jgi:hypothetical protein
MKDGADVRIYSKGTTGTKETLYAKDWTWDTRKSKIEGSG